MSESKHHNDPSSSSSDEDDPEYQIEKVQVLDNKNDSCFYCFHIWTIVPPTVTFLSHLHSLGEEISGTRVWMGSLLLAQYFCLGQLGATTVAAAAAVDHTNDFLFGTNHLCPRILELGCGTGILGMTISKVLIHRRVQANDCKECCAVVVLTDGDERAMELLQKNIQNPDNQIDTTVVGCHLLKWGSDQNYNSHTAFETWCRSSRWKHLWDKETHESSRIQFDTIVAGDVLYKQELPQLFFETAHTLLAKDTGVLWLCHVPRADITHEVVIAEANRAGFQVEQVSFDKVRTEGFSADDDISRAQIYRMIIKS